MTYRFTTVITKEGRWRVARCVELGVVSQGKTVREAENNLKEAVSLYLEDRPKSRRTYEKPVVKVLHVQHA